MALGTALGVFMGRNRRWNALLDGVLVVGLNVPALVVIILCYIWFGLGEFAAILAVAVNKFPIIDVPSRKVLISVPVGMVPYGILIDD